MNLNLPDGLNTEDILSIQQLRLFQATCEKIYKLCVKRGFTLTQFLAHTDQGKMSICIGIGVGYEALQTILEGATELEEFITANDHHAKSRSN